MALALADILREHWQDYARAHRSSLNAVHYQAVRRVLACRTPALGGHLYQCTHTACGKKHYAYHSCNHRNCTQCGARDQQLWTAKQEAKLLGVPYFLITFTIPAPLRTLCLHQPKTLYHLLLKCSAQALTDICRTKLKNTSGRTPTGQAPSDRTPTGQAPSDRTPTGQAPSGRKPAGQAQTHPHLQLGLTSVLHTWDRRGALHPHIHCIVPAIAYDPATQTLIRPPKPDQFLVHFRPLADRFRSLIHTALRDHHPDLYRTLTSEQHRTLSPAQKWNVQLQPAGTGTTAVRYLARYVHRSAFSARRILGYDPQGRIKLRWTDSNTKKTSILHLHPHEFLRRWCLHILPKGFARTRHYGFAAPAAKKARTQICHLLGQKPLTPSKPPEPAPFTCPHCQSELRFLKNIPRPRGPPS